MPQIDGDGIVSRHNHLNQVEAPPPPKPPEPKPVAAEVAPQAQNFGADSKKGEVQNRDGAVRQDLEIKDKNRQEAAAAVNFPLAGREIKTVGAAVAGAVAGSRAATSTAEKVGFAPRTSEAAKAARVVAQTINQEIAAGRLPSYSDSQQTIGAAIHKDGSVTITASGDHESTQKLYDEKLYNRADAVKLEAEARAQGEQSNQTQAKPQLTSEEIAQRKEEARIRREQKEQGVVPENADQIKAQRASRRDAESQAKAAQQVRDEAVAKAQQQIQETIERSPSLKSKIQQNLNEAFKDNPNVKRTNGNVDFEWGKASSDLHPREATVRGANSEIVKMERTADNCAAGKMYHADKTNGGRNPVVAADEAWRPGVAADDVTARSTSNPHADPIKINNEGSHSMSPCSSCTTNNDKVKGGNYQPEAMTLRSAGKTGAIGAGTAAVASTLEQYWNTGHVDAGKVASDAALAAPTAIAGEAIERAATPGATRAAENVVNRVAGQALTTGEAKAVSSTLGKLGGAGAAGAVISGAMEAYNQRDNFLDANKRPDAVGAVAGQAVVGLAAGVAGAQAGAAIGTFIPIPGVGTVVGAAVGFGVGYALSATGADKAIAGGVSTAYRATEQAVGQAATAVSNAASNVGNAVSGAANKVASWLGW